MAVTNHTSDREISTELPWAGGHRVHELTTEEPEWRLYSEGKHIAFPPYSVRVFEIRDGQVPVTFWDYRGSEPNELDKPLGLNLDQAFRNENMTINNHWNTAMSEDNGQEAS